MGFWRGTFQALALHNSQKRLGPESVSIPSAK